MNEFRMIDPRPHRDPLMTVACAEIVRLEMIDECPDLSHLDADSYPDKDPEHVAEDLARREAYRFGDWHCIGIRASATFLIGLGDVAMIQTIESPGVWGIESDSDAAYLDEAFEDEKATLLDILGQLGVTVTED